MDYCMYTVCTGSYHSHMTLNRNRLINASTMRVVQALETCPQKAAVEIFPEMARSASCL